MSAGPSPAALRALRDADAAFQGRSRASDGIMGDARHQATLSDHNTGNAFDLTVDEPAGVVGAQIAEHAQLDPRTKYVIFNGQIWNPAISPKWRRYDGQNPHRTHVHVSIKAERREDASPWGWAPDVYDDGRTGGLVAVGLLVVAAAVGFAVLA